MKDDIGFGWSIVGSRLASRIVGLLLLSIGVVSCASNGDALVGRSDLTPNLNEPTVANVEATMRDACLAAPRQMRCFAITSPLAVRPHGAGGIAPFGTCTIDLPPCYGPKALRAAYGVSNTSTTGGKGITIAIVDAYGYPSAKQDLAKYRRVMKLPSLCSDCLRIVNQRGGNQPPDGVDAGWDIEQAIDLQMVSALCPQCHVILIEAKSPYTTDLTAAFRQALKMADITNLSWGGNEYTTSSGAFALHPGKVVVASAGDSGAGAQQPCSFVGVICVGGTALWPSKSSRGWDEVVWDDLVTHQCGSGPCATGSGCSTFITKPAWQTDKGCIMRSESDISAVADPNTGIVYVYGGTCCYISGGTSVASPLIAGIIAVSANPKAITPASIWAKGGTSAYNPVTIGTNENVGAGTYLCPTILEYICKAGTHMAGLYSGPAGWGTPRGTL